MTKEEQLQKDLELQTEAIGYLRERIAELEKACEETQELLDKQIEATYRLDKENAEQKKQIEKMKCCANCKHYFCMCENVDDEKQYCDKWELAE